jgi:hypothetical protein
MDEDMVSDRNDCNRCRFVPGQTDGHYESYFQRANHPSRPLAFWIRYTIFSPKGAPAESVGELWAIHFDGEVGQITAAKEVVPISECQFLSSGLDVRIGKTALKDGRLDGAAASGGHAVRWSLRYEGEGPPLLLFPRSYYDRRFPKAKALVGTPNAVYQGTLTVDEQEVAIDGWIGSQNHNWGSRHTDHYAWGQVAGFDNAPDAFLECSTARVRLGPLWSPWFTLIVLRVDGREYALNTLGQALRAHGRFDYFIWNFDSRGPVRCTPCAPEGSRGSETRVGIRGRIQAPASAFVGLRYDNPPGGHKTCLNTKLARCELVLEQKGKSPRALASEHRAAFEILTDDRDHGIPVVL